MALSLGGFGRCMGFILGHLQDMELILECFWWYMTYLVIL